jgi:hypothetical protein
MVQLLGCQPFPVIRIAGVAFRHILRRMPDWLAVPEDGEPAGERMLAGTMV